MFCGVTSATCPLVDADAPLASDSDNPAAPKTGTALLRRFRFEACLARAIRVLPFFCQGSLCSIADGTSKTFYLRYGSASKQRNCQIFTICDCDPILRPEVDSHNIGKRTQPRLIEVPIRVFSHDSLA